MGQSTSKHEKVSASEVFGHFDKEIVNGNEVVFMDFESKPFFPFVSHKTFLKKLLHEISMNISIENRL